MSFAFNQAVRGVFMVSTLKQLGALADLSMNAICRLRSSLQMICSNQVMKPCRAGVACPLSDRSDPTILFVFLQYCSFDPGSFDFSVKSTDCRRQWIARVDSKYGGGD